MTGELNQPGQLGVSQVGIDGYVRPRQDNAGANLAQLGAALSSLNPGLGAILGKYTQEADRQQEQADQSQGASERESIRDAVEAQKYLQANRGTWTEARLAGFEMNDAQIHANMYPGALKKKLEDSGLWNKENANPEEIQAAMAEVRAEFIQRGQGNSPIWQRTFDQYRQGFENGVTNQWTQHAGQLREDKAERMVADDLTSQLLSHQQLPTVEEVAKSFNQYAEKSYTNISLYPSQVNQLKVKAFLAAHSSAINSGNEALATRIMAAFDQIPTKDNNGNVQYLSKTEYGGNALAKMHQDTYYKNRQDKAEEQEKKEDLKQAALSTLFTLKEQYRGLLPSQIPAVLPDETLRRSLDTIGLDGDAEWSRFRQSRLTSDAQVSQEDSRAALDSVSQLRTKLRNAETKGQLREVLDQAHNLDSSPDFSGHVQREELNQLLGEITGQSKRYEETGKMGSRAYRVTEDEVKGLGREMATQATAAIAKYQKTLEGGALEKTLAKFKFQQNLDPDTGALTFGFADLNRQMMDDFLAESDAVAGDQPWDKVDRATLRQAGDAVMKKYRPLFEGKVKELEQGFADEKKAKDAVQNREEDVVVSKVTNEQTPRVGASGLNTSFSLKNVEKAVGSRQYLKSFSAVSNSPERALTDRALQAADLFQDDNRNRSWLNKTNESVSNPGERAATNMKLAWFGTPQNPYRTGNQREDMPVKEVSYDATNGVMKNLGDLLNKYEKDPVLQKAVNETVTSGSMSTTAPPGDQVKYVEARSAYLEAARHFGVPSELSTSSKPPFRPEWLDAAAVPLFNYVDELREDNTDNIKQAMKNVGLDPSNAKAFAEFVINQRGLVQKRALNYGIPALNPAAAAPKTKGE